ncbi:putative bifunctional diguanylate cyclase/phosphodiesterase [Teichococcus coralli]|uniref:putative bifunctional diguanylate cyclase/phosphodiesterase n=1 Tax=Teichococcus coralli TaxID=2545983 RepID=UPI0013702BEF|nr:EAL domain-containing protein [Pseudoroseomonas coralli]
MSRLATRAFKPALAVFAATIVLAAVYTSVLIVERQDALRQVSRYNVAWLTSQAVVELQKLEQRVAASGLPGSGVDQDEVELRLDILANRVQVLSIPEVRDLSTSKPELGTVVADLASAVREAQAMVPHLSEQGTIHALLQLLSPLERKLAGLAAAANARGGDLVAEDQRQLSQLHWTFSGVMVILAACGLGLYALLLWRNTLLRQTHQELLLRSRELDTQNGRFDAALNNMSQALCMVDAEQRLIVCNHRYLELFGLTPELAAARTPIRMILASIRLNGGPEGALAEEIYAEQQALVRKQQALDFFCQHSSGRAIAVFHRPMGTGWIATYEDITVRRQTEARIAYLAHYDPLTGLLNRVLFREEMERFLKALSGGDEQLALLCLDLDSFKEVNDTLGHPAGDALLRVVAQRLQLCVGAEGRVARLSGDEFAILYPVIRGADHARQLAGQIISAVGEPIEVEGRSIVVGVSVGAVLAERDGRDAVDLLRKADIALYCSKTAGGNGVRFFEPQMQTKLEARRTLEAELRSALDNGELVLFYQPIYSLRTLTICGFEALLRWRHPERGMIPPADFIPIAEATGLIVPIGEWVIRQACADAVLWPDHIRIAVNLSALQFTKSDLLQTIAAALASTGLSPTRLELEVTESVLLRDDESTIAILHQLRALGHRIALDDFGTGYSSLSYLRSFPFDKIKIDQSFVREMAGRADCASIVNAVAGLAQDLGIGTTAEGVETEEQVQQLVRAGCTEVQGYRFGRPGPAPSVAQYFTNQDRPDRAHARVAGASFSLRSS